MLVIISKIRPGACAFLLLFVVSCVPETRQDNNITDNPVNGENNAGKPVLSPEGSPETGRPGIDMDVSQNDEYTAGQTAYETANTEGEIALPDSMEEDDITRKLPMYNEEVTVAGKTDENLLRNRGPAAVKEQNIYYDHTSESYDLLQKANESMAGFPVNRVGEVDWVKAISRGLINPRSSITGQEPGKTRNDVIILENTKEMPNVRFPHSTHSYWLDCSNCHDRIFIPRIGSNQMDMNKIFRGQFCGVCHNKVAFTTYMCETCHSGKKHSAVENNTR